MLRSSEVLFMLFILLALCLPSAHAFAPTDETWIGIEPNRIYRYHDGTQTRLRHGKGWQAFTAGVGDGWLARFDEKTGTPVSAWGPPIAIGPARTAAEVERALLAFFREHGENLGIDPSALKLRKAGWLASNQTWTVDFDRLVDGVPVWRGGVSARVRDGRLFLLQVKTYPQWQHIGPAVLGADEAFEVAALEGPAAMGEHTDVETRLVVLPWEGDGWLEPRLCWEVRSRTVAPLGHWVSFVDAATGELLNVYNEVRFFSGTITGTHNTRTVDGSYTTSPMPYITLSGSDGSSVTADGSGGFTVSDAASWTASLSGTYVRVRNQQGANGSLSVSASSTNWTSSNATLAEIDSYRFLHDVRDWGQTVDPDNGMSVDRLTSNVNINSACNAYYDGNVNFYRSGSGCNNTGQIADVNYHEWGHGFHYYAVYYGSGDYDGSVSEGAGDTISAFLTADSEIAPYFMTNGSGIRDIGPDRVYPDDIYGEVHEDGLIWAGAVWDTWEAMTETYGETRTDRGRAWEAAGRAFAGALRQGPTTAETYDAFVVADDDNGNLADGTPHICEIIEGFALHGLGPGGTTSLLSVDHLPLGNQAAEVDIPVSGSVLNLASACSDFTLSRTVVHYSTDHGATWDEVELGVTGDRFDGAIPGLPDGSVVEYYLEAVATDGTTVYLPSGGEIAPFMFYVGALEEVYCADFEADDGGYTHALLEGTEQQGADDWRWGAPTGAGGDPEAAYSGVNVWGNDLGGGNYNGQYQPNIVNRLTSQPIDVGGNDTVVVQFRRWLGVEDGYYDQANFYVNDVLHWSNHATSERIGDEATEDGDWMLHTARVDGVGGSVTLAWEIASDGGLEFGGWNIDDVCVYVPLDTQTLFRIDDFQATDDLDGKVTLTWTQPDDPRAQRAIVVRRDDRFPENRDDGEVVYNGVLSPGQAVTADDPSTGTWYYAVFAGGDVGYLTGATEGANADQGTGLDQGEPGGDTPGENPEKDGEKLALSGACGCASTGDAGAASLFGLLAGTGLVLRRRRR